LRYIKHWSLAEMLAVIAFLSLNKRKLLGISLAEALLESSNCHIFKLDVIAANTRLTRSVLVVP